MNGRTRRGETRSPHCVAREHSNISSHLIGLTFPVALCIPVIFSKSIWKCRGRHLMLRMTGLFSSKRSQETRSLNGPEHVSPRQDMKLWLDAADLILALCQRICKFNGPVTQLLPFAVVHVLCSSAKEDSEFQRALGKTSYLPRWEVNCRVVNSTSKVWFSTPNYH